MAALQQHTQALAALAPTGDPDDKDEDAPDFLQLSNRLWAAAGLRPDPGYLDDIATAFDADLQTLDFMGDPEGSTNRINQTIDEETDGLVEELLDQPLDRATVAVLTNALHLRARWAVPFTTSAQGQFRAASGAVDVPLMSGATGTGRQDDGWQSVELPYRDGTLTAVAVLPPESTDPCAIDAPRLAALQDAEPEDVGVTLPELQLDQSHQLLDILTALGLPARGDYSGLGEDDLEITQVVQDVVLAVDENGTEAAAATAVGVEATSAQVPPRVVAFDRPFLLVLTDTATGSPLFVATVQNPSR